VLVRIDDFDRLSAARGRRVADIIVDAMARHLAASVRGMDAVAAYDDATFALLLPGLGTANTIIVAERLRQTIAASRLPLEDGPVQFTVSVGATEAVSGDDTTRLLRRSEESLSAAAKCGGNSCYFHNGQWSELVPASVCPPVA
jgi:diguanylate cyclase (GGDEF)-like protein